MLFAADIMFTLTRGALHGVEVDVSCRPEWQPAKRPSNHAASVV